MTERRAEQSWVDYVTMMIGDQLLGLPITRVRDVFVPGRVTPVPLSPPEVAGILNLRGRIVTAIDVRLRLDLSRRPAGWPVIAIGIEQDRQCYVLLFDAVGEVMRFNAGDREPMPPHLGGRLARMASGVHRLASQFLVVLDVNRVLALDEDAIAA
jgi:purine-binding chemotaxis protein CheW